MSFEKPKALSEGDRVAVIAPAGPFDRAPFEAGLARLSERYQAVWDPGVFSRSGYLAGSDPRRAEELSAAMRSPQIKAVFCARGGYGTMRLLKKLDFSSWQLKPLVGFSDITALHCALLSARRTAIHGPVLTQLGKLSLSDASALFRTLEDPGFHPELEGESWGPGIAEGHLIGGNLAVLSRLIGTPFLPVLDGAVLLLEDVGELPYRLDRMWTHLNLAGFFQKIKGLALGSFTACDDKNDSPSASSQTVLRELVAETGLPCVANLPIGHGQFNHAVSLGTRFRIDGGTGRLQALESAVEAAT